MAKEYNEKPMKYVWNMVKMTLFFSILIQLSQIMNLHHIFLIDIFPWSSYNFKTFLSAMGTTVPWFLQPCIKQAKTELLVLL